MVKILPSRRLQDINGEFCPDFGDGGISGVIGSRMRSFGSGIKGNHNCDKSVACSIRD